MRLRQAGIILDDRRPDPDDLRDERPLGVSYPTGNRNVMRTTGIDSRGTKVGTKIMMVRVIDQSSSKSVQRV